MRKSIFLLLMLLIACSPASTSTPTSTPIPPIATATPPPTETPTPTPTPEGFQTSPDGNVQVYENGNWVDMSTKIPDTIWGEKPEGASVVLKDGEALLQMQLNNFQTADGSTSVDIAKYNKETKKWKVVPFSITRTLSLQNYEIAEINNSIKKYNTPENVNVFSSMVTFLGLRVVSDNTASNRLEYMFLYKGQPVVFTPQEVWELGFDPDISKLAPQLIDDNDWSLQYIIEATSGVEKNNNTSGNINGAFLKIFVLDSSADEKSCSFTWNNHIRQNFSDWCKVEVEKGQNRKIPNKINLDWFFKNQPKVFVIDESFDMSDLNNLWNLNPTLTIDGAFISVLFVK